MTLLFTLIGCLVQAEEINLSKYKTSHKWFKSPDIVICHDSPVTKADVQKAKKEWVNAGLKIGKVTKSKKSCSPEKYKKGSILIMGDRDDLDASKYHAITIRWYEGGTNRAVVESAFIEIDSDVVYLQQQALTNLLVHEIGHALGYGHTKIKNDVMNGDIMH